MAVSLRRATKWMLLAINCVHARGDDSSIAGEEKAGWHIAAHHHQSADDGARSAGSHLPEGWFQFTPMKNAHLYAHY